MNDEILFAEEKDSALTAVNKFPWKIIIADDEHEVHAMTRIILKDIKFEDRPLELISAYSGRETIEKLKENPETAIILLDVVMEDEHSGLKVVDKIRNELKNNIIRIILRTGQPGQAPERKVITQYDINDYKEKTELTAQKLFTVIISALRSYRDLVTIDLTKKGLEKIINSTENLFRLKSLEEFTSGVLIQIASLMHLDIGMLLSSMPGIAAIKERDAFKIITIVGDDSIKDMADIPTNIIAKFNEAATTKQTIIRENEYIGFFPSPGGLDNYLYLKGNRVLTPVDIKILNVFSSNIAIAFDNIFLYEQQRIKDEMLKQAQKMESIGTLAGGIAHDFKNMTGAIISAVNFLNNQVVNQAEIDRDELKSFLDIIEISGRQSAELIKQLMTLSRSNKVEMEPVNLVNCIKLVSSISRTFDKNIEVDVQCSEEKALALADASEIDQVLLNLCINASHAMTLMRSEDSRKGGTLTIGLKKINADKAFCTINPAAKEGIYWRISVADTGVGMSNEVIEKIYNPFFTTKKAGSGTGLGLSMVYNIIKQHHGFIFVDSTEGCGTVFEIYIPVLNSKEDEAKPKVNHKYVGNQTILLAEPDEINRMIGKEILSDYGYDVITSVDGNEALMLFNQHMDKIDLVILSLVMPEANGREVFLKMQKAKPDVKVILSLVYNDQEEMRLSNESGLADTIDKPFTDNNLPECVYNAINMR